MSSKTLEVAPPGLEGRLEKQWKWNPMRRELRNAVHGQVYHVIDVIDSATGLLSHEAVVDLSRRAELHVTIRDQDSHIALALMRREKVVDPEWSDEFFKTKPGEIPSIEEARFGIEEYQCAQGLSKVTGKEAEEEMGYKVVEMIQIGHLHHATPFGGVAHMLYATLISDVSSGRNPHASEQIRGTKFFAPEEVRDILILCGMTTGALWKFRAWGLKKPQDTPWYRCAARM